MRLEAGDGNPLTLRCVVLLDGKVQKHAFVADEDDDALLVESDKSNADRPS